MNRIARIVKAVKGPKTNQGDVAREVLALATADWYAKLEASETTAR